MTRAPGTRFGPYEIQSAIGAGGMGEVYKATDTNLKRSVAIKAPASLAGDAERLVSRSTKRCPSRNRSPRRSKRRTSKGSFTATS